MAKRRREKALLFQTKMFNARYLRAKLVKRASSAVAQSVVLPLLHFSEVRSNHEFYSLFLFFSSTNLFQLQFLLFAY